MSKAGFWENKIIVINLSSAELAQRVAKVNTVARCICEGISVCLLTQFSGPNKECVAFSCLMQKGNIVLDANNDGAH